MTEQESNDIERARMLISLDVLNGPNKEMLVRICDGFVEKCARITCIREKAEALMTRAEEAIMRKTCGRNNLCGSVGCPQGYACPESHMKDGIAALRECLGSTGQVK